MEESLGFRLGGSDREYVAVSLTGRTEWTESVELWSSADVSIRSGGFSGHCPAAFVVEDFAAFLDELRRVWQTLSGEASFEPLEGQLRIRVVGNGRGEIKVTGEACDMPRRNSLQFNLDLDQTYLEQTVRQLEATVARMTPEPKSSRRG